ncbi:hypothetical protein B0H15DRAFT_949825 [Mycena belliarum]|uniref:Uncharacterized protein n=1 Tax=Mycena belliarum TaxID=1033014 RepID=A0AAD6XRS2_9AGAR|nr:hypothetical protein B0H15DRAFT_949825 [Mycena belliae]
MPRPAPPPMKSMYTPGPTAHELETKRRAERNEKARVRIARKRAELKLKSLEEQHRVADRSRAYQAKYREKNRQRLRTWEALRRLSVYRLKYGEIAYTAYLEARSQREARAYARSRRGEAYHSADEDASADGYGSDDGYGSADGYEGSDDDREIKTQFNARVCPSTQPRNECPQVEERQRRRLPVSHQPHQRPASLGDIVCLEVDTSSGVAHARRKGRRN